ncbi:MAG: CDP-alcohol phosphatidyltransferase family protein [Sandaracinaceae bacterium]
MPRRYTFKEVRAAVSPDTNWSKFFVHPLSDGLLYLIANHAPVHPNVLTGLAFLAALAAAPLFASGDASSMRLGAGLFYLAFLLDSIDGGLARLTDRTSKLGALLDVGTDFLRSALLGAALTLGTAAEHPWAVPLGLLVTCLALYHYFLAELSRRLIGSSPGGALGGLGARLRSLGLAANPFGLPDMEAIALVIFPLMGLPFYGLVLAAALGTSSRLAATLLVMRKVVAESGD